MGLRHIKPGLTAAHEAGTGILHPTLVHPRTGEPLEAVGVGKNGQIWWPVLGGAEDDDSGDDDDHDDEDDDGDKDDDADEGGDEDEKDPKAKIDALIEEKERHYKRRKKAEKELAEARAEIEKLKAANKKPKKSAVTDDADEDSDDDEEKVTLRADNEKAKAELRKAKIENAFLRINTGVEWVNPAQVMTLLLADDDYEVEFDTNGNIDRKSLAAELKRFAKANQHLVKPKPKKSSEDDGEGENDSSGKSSGAPMNGQRKGKGTKEPTREELAKKYPALNL